MRHNKTGRKLSRKTAHRKALMANLASALITHKKIKTTDAKAKELRRYVEPLVTFAKRGDLHAKTNKNHASHIYESTKQQITFQKMHQ